MAIRNSVKCVVIDDGKILLNRCMASSGEYYALPGGGQQLFETLCEAAVRECREETGYVVSPVRLLAVSEAIDMDQRSRKSDPDYAHKVYFVFLCEPLSKGEPTETDSTQTGCEWVDINRIPYISLFPKLVWQNFAQMMKSGQTLFLGSETVPGGGVV